MPAARKLAEAIPRRNTNVAEAIVVGVEDRGTVSLGYPKNEVRFHSSYGFWERWALPKAKGRILGGGVCRFFLPRNEYLLMKPVINKSAL